MKWDQFYTLRVKIFLWDSSSFFNKCVRQPPPREHVEPVVTMLVRRDHFVVMKPKF